MTNAKENITNNNSETVTFSAANSETVIDSSTMIETAEVDSSTTPATVLTDSEKAKKEKPAKTSNKKKESKPKKDSKETEVEEKPVKKSIKDKSVKKDEPAKKSKFSVKKPQKVEKEEKPKEPSAYEKMFPAEFVVQGVKFTRLDLGKTDILRAILQKYVEILNSDENKGLCFAVNWDKELLTKHGNRHSEYQNTTGLIPPSEFPNNLDINLIDNILRFSAKVFVTHSIYTEFPASTPFEIFEKREKEGWFANVEAPAEFYEVDFTNAENENAAMGFINLYSDDENKNG